MLWSWLLLWLLLLLLLLIVNHLLQLLAQFANGVVSQNFAHLLADQLWGILSRRLGNSDQMLTDEDTLD